MPRIKRWFPVSQDINHDPDVWVMREKYGEKSLSIWLEILSIADRNDGEIPGDFDQLVSSIGARCRTRRSRVKSVFSYGLDRVWLKFNDRLRVSNYAKYHRTREPNLSPSEPSEPILTKPIPPKSPRAKKKLVHAEGFDLFWKEYPRKTGHGKARESWDKIRPSKELTEKIMRAVEIAKESRQWRRDSGQFIPLPATWLNQERYEDGPEPRPSGPGKTLAQITKEAEERSRRKREEK